MITVLGLLIVGVICGVGGYVLGNAERRPSRYLTCPMSRTPEQALDWFERHGVDPSTAVLWQADDGSIRGRGRAR